MADAGKTPSDHRYLYIRDGQDHYPRLGLGFMLIALGLAFFMSMWLAERNLLIGGTPYIGNAQRLIYLMSSLNRSVQ